MYVEKLPVESGDHGLDCLRLNHGQPEAKPVIPLASRPAWTPLVGYASQPNTSPGLAKGKALNKTHYADRCS